MKSIEDISRELTALQDQLARIELAIAEWKVFIEFVKTEAGIKDAGT